MLLFFSFATYRAVRLFYGGSCVCSLIRWWSSKPNHNLSWSLGLSSLWLTMRTAYRHVHENPEYSCGSRGSKIRKISSGVSRAGLSPCNNGCVLARSLGCQLVMALADSQNKAVRGFLMSRGRAVADVEDEFFIFSVKMGSVLKIYVVRPV